MNTNDKFFFKGLFRVLFVLVLSLGFGFGMFKLLNSRLAWVIVPIVLVVQSWFYHEVFQSGFTKGHQKGITDLAEETIRRLTSQFGIPNGE